MKNFLLLAFFLLIFFCVLIAVQKENKEELAKYYKITKPTLNKWVKYFPCHITFDVWITKRKLMILDSSSIKYKWGNNVGMVLNKGQIADLGSASKKAVTKCVLDNLERIGITEEAWRKCSVFPPVISERIIGILTGNPVPTFEEKFASLFTNSQAA